MIAPIKNPKTLIKELFRLERSGRYDEALEELRNVWDDTATFPSVNGLQPRIAAEIILRCGSLVGFHGHNCQLPDAQEKSKNLLSDARDRFLALFDIEKVAECENYLALAYWRTGEFVEAETWVEESTNRHLKETNEVRLYSYLIKSFIMLSLKRFTEIVACLSELEMNFLAYGDDFLNGSFNTNFGVALKNLGKTSGALVKFEAAKFHHEKSGHVIYLGTVENNLAQTYKLQKKFLNAHESVDNATKIFQKIKDRTREGFSLDTKAQIYFDEENYVEALITVERALNILQKGENAGYLAETYLTKSKILLAFNDFTSATFALFDGVQIAKTKISEESAANLIREFEAELINQNTAFVSKIFSEDELISGDLELSLPPSISHYSQYQAVRIKNTHLEKIGLTQNSLAIVVDEIVSRGDLAAVSEIKDGSIFCGYFDSDFGIVCLEGVDSEPQLLNESEVKILGKIVGVCDGIKNANGKLVVKPL